MHFTTSISRRLRIGAGALALSFSLFSLTACAPQSGLQSETVIEPQTDLMADPSLVTGVLENGLRYAVLRNQTPPGTGALRVQFQTGSLNELPGTEGLAHYLEHMAFNGSKNVPEGEMIKILERLGLSFGADTNASTGLDRTVYKLNLPTLDTEVLDAAFMLMKETAQNLTLDQDAIERELGIILSEKRTRDSANYRSWETRMRFLSKGSDLMDRLPIGNEKSLRSLKAEDFKAYYSAHYHPEKTIVAFVGDYDPKDVVHYIKNTFADWKPTTHAKNDLRPRAAVIPKNEIEYYAEEGLSTNISLFALRPYVERMDRVSLRNRKLVEGLVTGMIGYRMSALTEVADRPFISATMRRMSNFELTEGISFTAYTQPEDWREALIGLDTELRRALKYGFTQSELDAQLARVQSLHEALAKGANTRPTTARNGGLIEHLMGTFNKKTVFTHPQQNLARFMEVKDTIDLDQVNKALHKLWGSLDDINIFVSTDRNIANIEGVMRQVLVDNRKIDISAPSQTDASIAKEFAYTNFGEAGQLVSDTYSEVIDAHFIKFTNNVRLNFKQTEFEKDRVMVRVTFGDGNMSTPRKNEGLRRLAYGIVSGSGFEKHTISETRRLMAGKLVTPSGFKFLGGGDSFYMSAVTVPENFREQLNIFTATLTAPGFREDARANHITKLKAWYPRHDTTLSGVVSKHVPRIIRSGDKRYGFDLEDDFYNSTMSEIEAWLRPQFETGLIEITIVGDVDKETVIKHVAETFGALPERLDNKKDYPGMLDIRFPEGSTTPHKIYHRGDDNQAQLRIYWPASDGFDAQYSRRLSVVRAILRNRLVKEIREGEATTYSPQAASHASQIFPDYGYVAAILTLKPEDVKAMASKVQSIAADIAHNSITQDEFNRAISPIIERLDSSDKRNPYWASVLSDSQTEGLGIKRHMTRESDLKDMQVTDVQTLATEIFDSKKTIEIHILPKKEG